MSSPTPIAYLRKATNDGICHCACPFEDAFVAPPAQAGCPWCGCGWLWTCVRCGKAFTFAERVLVTGGFDAVFGRHTFGDRLRSVFRADRTRDDAVLLMIDCDDTGVIVRQPNDREELRVPEHLFRMLVYFDGFPVPADAKGFRFDGLHGHHDLRVVPQVEALDDPTIVPDLLRNEAYWAAAATT